MQCSIFADWGVLKLRNIQAGENIIIQKIRLDRLISFVIGLQKFLTLYNFVFLRGAIIKDDLYCNSDFIFGEAIIKADAYERQRAKTFRIILDDECTAVVNSGLSEIEEAISYSILSGAPLPTFEKSDSNDLSIALNSIIKIKMLLDNSIDISISSDTLRLLMNAFSNIEQVRDYPLPKVIRVKIINNIVGRTVRDVDFDYTTKAVAKSTSLYINNILDISLSEKLYIDSEGEVSINYLSKPNTSFNNLVEQSLKYNIAPPSVREATPILMFSECESQQFFEECVVKNRNLIRHKQIEFAGNKKLQTKLYWLIKYHNDICGSHDLGKEYQISTKYRYIHPTLRTKQSKPFRR